MLILHGMSNCEASFAQGFFYGRKVFEARLYLDIKIEALDTNGTCYDEIITELAMC